MSAAPPIRMFQPTLLDALRHRYEAPEYAFLEQVRSRTGYGGAIRTADAMAMSLYPGRGLHLHGFEIKIDRRDWLREKKTPEKAEEIIRFCDRWWLVVNDEAMVREGELPPTWGLLVPGKKKGTLTAKVQAPALSPQPITRPFLAAILRNLAQAKEFMIPKAEMAVALERAREEVRNAPKPPSEQSPEARELVRLKREHDHLVAVVKQFEEASGVQIQIDRWYAKDIGDAVRTIQALDLPRSLDRADRIAEELRKSAMDLATLVKRARGEVENKAAGAPPAEG